MYVTMSEVVFQVIAIALKRIVAFVFDLPARPAGLGERSHTSCGDKMIGHPGIVIERFARIFARDGQFQPVHAKRVFTGP